MKYRIMILSAAVPFLFSCTEDPADISDGGSLGGKIVVSDVTTGSADTKSCSDGMELISTVENNGLTFKVYGSDELGIAAETKAGANEITKAELTKFNMYGYLGKEIKDKKAASQADKDDLNFIKDASVVKSGDAWNFASGTYYWRSGVNHCFWAYSPDSLGLNVDDSDVSKASFSSYENDGEQDVLVAYTKRYFGKDEESEDTRDPELSLQFHHTLAEFQLVKPSESAGDTRIEQTKFELRKFYSKGDCEISGTDGAITWSNLQDNTSRTFSLKTADEWFMIPQERSNLLVMVEIKDKQRELTMPYVFSGKEAFKEGKWLPGHRYRYTINFTYDFPDVSSTSTGIDANFTGKGFKTLAVVEGLAGKYISQIKITWTGLADTNGNGTYCMIGIADDGSTPAKPSSCSDVSALKAANIGFSYDSFHSQVILGEASGNPSSVGYNNVPCSCTIDIPEDMDVFDIYALYLGGTNGNGQVYWHMSNMKVEVTGWR